jgi:Na+-transporting NADH:ubiquinone oxidoreductase subunit B
VKDFLKKYIQYQKPMAAMLTVLGVISVFAIYNFGLRVLALLALANVACWGCEYFFTRKGGKPSSMAALVTAFLLVLACPPGLPVWMLIVGCVFAIVLTKMTFGGFGKNVFNPAIAGRCFLYVCFPIAMTGVWYGPASGAAGGFTQWLSNQKVSEYTHKEDVISGATILAGSKKLNAAVKSNKSPEEDIKAFQNLSLGKMLTGRISGSAGETSAILVILGFLYLLYRKAVSPVLAFAPLVGLWSTTIILSLAGISTLPLGKALLVNTFAGGTLFGCAFMITEPVSAPLNNKARWIYGIMIGFFATIIRAMSVFNAGFMFSILLGNMFGPVIEISVKSIESWFKNRSKTNEK